MEIKGLRLKALQQALGYSVMHAKTESETAEFALLKLDIESAINKENIHVLRQEEHDKMGCPFVYCAYTPKCVGKCGNS